MAKTFRFTTQRLERLPCPVGKDREYYRDSATQGLVLCVTTAGTKTFMIYRRVDGRPARVRLGKWPGELSIDGARKAAQKVNGKIADGIDPRQERRMARAEMTFGELFAKHIDHAKAHNKTWHENQRQYDRYLKRWSSRRLSEITRRDVEALHSRMGEKNGKFIANRTLALIHHIFARTATISCYSGTNPAHGVEKFREKSRERFLAADELSKFFKALEAEPELFQDFFMLALLTGARRANLQAMQWADINFERNVWRIPETKSGEPVTVPLVAEAIEILERRKLSHETEFVFPSHGKSGHLTEPKTAWKRIIARAGIADLRLHDLRRTFGSWQAAAGVG